MRLTDKLIFGAALAGLAVAVAVGLASNPAPPRPEPAAMPARAPFPVSIGGGGVVEPRSEVVAVSASLPGVVTAVHVAEGEQVVAGQPLFTQDGREAQAALTVRQAELAAAMAAVKEAEASLRDAATQYALVREATDNRAVSKDDREKRKNAELLARAKLESARAAVDTATASRDAAATDLDRLTVRAPLAGKVLQVNVRPGEYAATGELSTPLLRLGDVSVYHVRSDIDENDAWRFVPGTRAVAYVRGNRELRAHMRFVRVTPYVVSKTQLSGSSTERVDTRVLQVIFELDPNALPVYVGQQLDVFIEAPSATEPATDDGAAPPGGASGVSGGPGGPGETPGMAKAMPVAGPGENLFARAAAGAGR